MTLKQYIKNYFENAVEFNFDNETYNEQDFWNAWDKLCNDIDMGGIQWACEWYDDAPELNKSRADFITTAIDNYIKTDLQPLYTNNL